MASPSLNTLLVFYYSHSFSYSLPCDIPFLYSSAQRQENHPNRCPRHKNSHFQKNRNDTEKSKQVNRYNRQMTNIFYCTDVYIQSSY